MQARDVRYWLPMTTRWTDNDVYSHMNNSWHSHFFDSIVNDYLIRHCDLDPSRSSIIGLVVSQRVTFRKPIGYPEPLLVGLNVVKLGRSSVTYNVALFPAKRQSARAEQLDKDGKLTWELELADQESAASTEMVHVFVSADERKSVAMPEAMRTGFEKLLVRPPAKL